MRNVVPFVLLVCTLAAGARAQDLIEIRVDNQGSGVVEQDSVLVHIGSRVGTSYDPAQVSRDVKSLRDTGRFKYVGASADPRDEGVVLTFLVQNKHRLRTLKVHGADELSQRKIRKAAELEVGDLVDEAMLAMAARRVEEEYRKRYFIDPEVSWDMKEDPDSAAADVTLLLDEGQRSKVRELEFAGNTVFEDRELRKAMQQKRWWLFSFFNKAGVYKPDVVEADRFAIKALYLDRGYLDVEVSQPESLDQGDDRIDLRYTISEGQPYVIKDVFIEGAEIYDPEVLRARILMRPGDLASIGAIGEAARAVRDYYGSRGYIRTRVRPELDPDLDGAMTDVTFIIDEGHLAYIRDIRIRGNQRTKDKVIRRELTVYPGDIFNEVKVRTSRRRVQNLRYFSTVDATPVATEDPAEYDLEFEVAEQRTGQFLIGFGFSSIDDLIGFAEITQGNFDLLGFPSFTGAGQKLKLRVQAGTERRDIELTFIEPWFLDRKLSFELNLFQRDRRFFSDDYDQLNTGGRIGLGKAVGRFNRLNLSYTLEEIEVTDVAETASDQIKAEEGARIKSAPGLRLIHDSRDNFFISSRGTRASIGGEVAGGPFGGETDFYKLEGRLTHYVPLWRRHVLNLRGWMAGVEEFGDSDSVPIFDRLFLGGARTLRGFEFRDVGPKDENGEPLGGQTGWYGTVEYIVPVAPIARASTYYDIGMVYSTAYELNLSDYNDDFGFGLMLDLPGFPLRFDYAWPITADEYNDSSGRFNFMMGYVF